MYEEVSAEAVRSSNRAGTRPLIAVGDPHSHPMTFDALIGRSAGAGSPHASAPMHGLSCSIPRARPRARRACRDVSAPSAPRRSRMSRRISTASVSVRSAPCRSTTPWAYARFFAMSLIGGAFVCLPRFDVARALELIAAEKLTNLYLVPTLYHDLLHHERFQTTDVSSVRKLGFAGASDDGRPAAKPQGRVQAGPVRQSLWLIRNLHLHHRPERRREAGLGRTRRHQPDGARRAVGRDLTRRGGRTWRGRRGHRAARG